MLCDYNKIGSMHCVRKIIRRRGNVTSWVIFVWYILCLRNEGIGKTQDGVSIFMHLCLPNVSFKVAPSFKTGTG